MVKAVQRMQSKCNLLSKKGTKPEVALHMKGEKQADVLL